VAKKLYVGNLTYNVNESDLEALFSQFGTVQSAQIIVDRDTNRSKGFGFVEMDTDAQAQAAIQGLNGHDHDGRNLTVNEAKPVKHVAAAAAAATAAAVVVATAVVVAAVTAVAVVAAAVIDRPLGSIGVEGFAGVDPSTSRPRHALGRTG